MLFWSVANHNDLDSISLIIFQMTINSKKQLEEWKKANRYSISESHTSCPIAKKLIKACEEEADIEITYYGGTTPGMSRTISPRRLFRVSGYDFIYVEAYCYKRQEYRTFRTDRIGSAFVTPSKSVITDHTYNIELQASYLAKLWDVIKKIIIGRKEKA